MTFTMPTILQKIVIDKAEWVKNKEAEFPLSEFEKKTFKNPTALFMMRWQKAHTKNRRTFWNVKRSRLPRG